MERYKIDDAICDLADLLKQCLEWMEDAGMPEMDRQDIIRNIDAFKYKMGRYY